MPQLSSEFGDGTCTGIYLKSCKTLKTTAGSRSRSQCARIRFVVLVTPMNARSSSCLQNLANVSVNPGRRSLQLPWRCQ